MNAAKLDKLLKKHEVQYPTGQYDTWQVVEKKADGFSMRGKGGLAVIVSSDTELDGKRWKHVSVSHRNRIPLYDELLRVRRTFFSPDSTVYQVFPPADKHVNLHPFCLHLWECLDGPVTPDFSRGTGSI